MEIVRIYWKGPYSVKKAMDKFERSKERSKNIVFYQLYGRHLVFGRDSFLYIDRTADSLSLEEQICERVKEWKWEMDKIYPKKKDGKTYKKRRQLKDEAGVFSNVYYGKLYTGENGEKLITEKQKIEDVRKLLIYACSPPWNDNEFLDDIKDELYILNFGSCGSLPTEVSVPFWQNTKSRIRCYKIR